MLHASGLLFGGTNPNRASAHPIDHLTVPPGYIVERATEAGLVKFPMFAVFDDRGRLFVAESSGLDLYAELAAQTRHCRIRVLSDTDGDRVFDTSRVFADALVFPMGLAWRDDKLFVADPPDVVVLEDTDRDDRCDQRTVLLSGFGHTDNGSLHGLMFGPDGWLYMTMGSPDGYRLRLADGSMLEGESGALIRCRVDGSDPQVVCRGFENLVELVFTARGDVFGTVNWFRDVNKDGSQGLRDALVHLVEGGLYPYHREVGTPQPVTGQPLPPVSLFPAVALSGLAEYRGQAFPGMTGMLFSAQHNSRKIGRHVLVPDGSTYRSMDSDFVSSDDADFHPSDVVEDADGSLLIVDTGSWYIHHCPTGRIRGTNAPGGLYRVRHTERLHQDDPWGLKLDWTAMSANQLASLVLGDQRPSVRDRASGRLARLGPAAIPVLSAELRENPRAADQRPGTEEDIIWILSLIGTEPALNAIRSALTDARSHVVAAAARALSEHEDHQSAEVLGDLLFAESALVRRSAANSLAHCGNQSSLDAIWDALSRDPDRFTEHALIHAAHRIASAGQLGSALDHPHPRVRRAALLLIGQPPRPGDALKAEMLTNCLADSDSELRESALAILVGRPEWADTATKMIKAWLADQQPTNDQWRYLGRLVVAFQSHENLQRLIADELDDEAEQSSQQRAALLDILAETTLRVPPPRWCEAVKSALTSAEKSVRAGGVHVAAAWQLAQFDPLLARIAHSESTPVSLRLSALHAVASRRHELPEPTFTMLLAQLSEDIGPLTRLTAAEILGKSALDDLQLRRLLHAVQGDALISPDVILPAVKQSASENTSRDVADYLEASIRSGWKPPEEHLRKSLNGLPSLDQSDIDRLSDLLQQRVSLHQSALKDLTTLLEGGDARLGRAVFHSQKAACASCHRVGSDGGDVGPDLTRVGSVRASVDILEAIAFPSASIVQGYQSYTVVTADGRLVTGILKEKSQTTIRLREQSGAWHTILIDDVETMERLPTSMMPEGLSNVLTRAQLRDLLSYLQSLK